MVVVLREPKLIFIEEPRTASHSTHIWLIAQGLGMSPWYQPDKTKAADWHTRHHGPVDFERALYRGDIPRADFLRNTLSEYDYFAFVRNPFNTLVTHYVKAKQSRLDRKEGATQLNTARRSTSLTQYLQLLQAENPDKLPCEGFHLERLLPCRHVLKFEDGYPDVLFKFLERQGVALTDKQKAAFPHDNRTPRKKEDWRSYYDETSRKMAEEIYAKYTQLYNYKFEDD
jgi:hypothetical protein